MAALVPAPEPSPVRRAVAALDALVYASSAAPAAAHQDGGAGGDAPSGGGSTDSLGYLSPDQGSATEVRCCVVKHDVSLYRADTWCGVRHAQAQAHGLLPSDRLAYLRRLRTFRPGLWAGRPPCCDAVAAARHGWTAVGGEPDVLACTVPCCNARTALLLPASLEPSAVASVRALV